ncbi:conserved protein of unknown function [Rhodovastum atsumiense]|uniref:Uncharacterized protein n=1 Tax=Rhodovastum atsumiense TaxID=504468 RepID=A0A5M6IRE1_9PROT|nr:hypothetical protein [Rhodovastum atsumiense]KAA5610870.1 hypothetical protein F1189_17500 [Rhodovastum atsumiense]CAH2602073.1 conserved protein of unknown function [Rhodovastum atsumiense]
MTLSPADGGKAARRLAADAFTQVATALSRGAEGVAMLPCALLRHVPIALLHHRIGRHDAAVVEAWLARLPEAGASAPERLWAHYLFSLEADDPASQAVAHWLSRHRDRLPARLQEFSRTYAVLDPGRAPVRMAAALLEGDRFIRDLEGLGFTLGRLQGSALMVSILGGIGALLRNGAPASHPVRAVHAVLAPHPRDAFHRAQVGEELRRHALAAFIEGFVAWQRRADPGDISPVQVADLLVTVNRDPRISPGRWQGVVPEATIDLLERWPRKFSPPRLAELGGRHEAGMAGRN